MSDGDFSSNRLISLVVVDFNAGRALERCLESALQRDDVPTEVIVVDNASSDGSAVALATRFPEVRLLQNADNLGFAAAANRGLAAARGQWIGLLNPDVEIPAGALSTLVAFLDDHPRVGAVGPALMGLDGTPQPFSYGGDPSLTYLVRRGWERLRGQTLHQWAGGDARTVDWVSGACLIARREAWEQVGWLDDGFFLYFEDVDWCRRCRQQGWDVYFVPEVEVTHLSRPSYADLARRQHYLRGLQRYYQKYYGAWAGWILKTALLRQK
ncbi:MAG TPA: glycosyltransferase family 2 protein [Chloroflexota bacterium]|nr:glycosyltransferase family 2 protein [Chloroflexota bacterium]